jgi:hypothetical protein
MDPSFSSTFSPLAGGVAAYWISRLRACNSIEGQWT